MLMSISSWPQQHAERPIAYLTTIGRVTGEPHRIEIWFAVDGERILLMSGGGDRSDWVKNLIANPTVQFELGSETHTGRANVITPDSNDDARARDMLVEKYQKADELADWRVRSLPIEVTFP